MQYFVYDTLTRAGAYVPLTGGHFNEYPPTADQWASENDSAIPGWHIVESPQPGDVVAGGGHVGIVISTEDELTMSSINIPGSGGTIRFNDWGFRDGPGEDVVIFRRYDPFCKDIPGAQVRQPSE